MYVIAIPVGPVVDLDQGQDDDPLGDVQGHQGADRAVQGDDVHHRRDVVRLLDDVAHLHDGGHPLLDDVVRPGDVSGLQSGGDLLSDGV